MESVSIPRLATVAPDQELSLLAEVIGALQTEANKADRLRVRLEHSVAQGDRMLAELGIATR